MLTCAELLNELRDVLTRPAMRKYFTVEQAMQFVVLFQGLGLLLEIGTSEVKPISRDPKDDYLLRLSNKGKAGVLVTGDKDLLTMVRFGTTRIMNAREFTEEYLK